MIYNNLLQYRVSLLGERNKGNKRRKSNKDTHHLKLCNDIN